MRLAKSLITIPAGRESVLHTQRIASFPTNNCIGHTHKTTLASGPNCTLLGEASDAVVVLSSTLPALKEREGAVITMNGAENSCGSMLIEQTHLSPTANGNYPMTTVTSLICLIPLTIQFTGYAIIDLFIQTPFHHATIKS